jgi:predicted HicB family RNase H-like nuclease
MARIQIVARIAPDLRKAVARVAKSQKTTLNALVDAALRAYVDRAGAPRVSKNATEESR